MRCSSFELNFEWRSRIHLKSNAFAIEMVCIGKVVFKMMRMSYDYPSNELKGRCNCRSPIAYTKVLHVEYAACWMYWLAIALISTQLQHWLINFLYLGWRLSYLLFSGGKTHPQQNDCTLVRASVVLFVVVLNHCRLVFCQPYLKQ